MYIYDIISRVYTCVFTLKKAFFSRCILIISIRIPTYYSSACDRLIFIPPSSYLEARCHTHRV